MRQGLSKHIRKLDAGARLGLSRVVGAAHVRREESCPSTCAASLALEKLFLSVLLSGAPRILTLAIGRKDLCLLISL